MAPQIMHVLFEHAAGYALFRVKEFEELGLLQPEVEESVVDLSRFNSVVKLVAFSPFRSGTNALDNMNSISEGIVHEDLRTFLETNLPQTSKKSKNVLGVGDAKLGASINEALGTSCMHYGVVPEIMRGIRLHAAKLIKGMSDTAAGKSQLGLGHSYSRAKVKFNVNRADNMIIQSSSLSDQMEKDLNTNCMRLGEWYSYHFPELKNIIKDNYMYARVTQVIGDRHAFTQDKLDKLEEIVMDSAKVKAIHDAARMSMGMDIAEIDLINVERFAEMVISLSAYKRELQEYLKNKMFCVAPNMSTLIGEQVGARLISQAGSLTNLAKYPASTVQILGAEKALFRALKTRGNTPKYGLIFHSTFIGRAGPKNKGRISRYLANKTSIAARIDCFSEFQTTIFGTHLRDQVEERLKFYDTGEAPKKNVDIMHLAITEASEAQIKQAKEDKKKAKKKKHSADESVNDSVVVAEEEVLSNGEKKKKKKSKKDKDENGAMNVSLPAMKNDIDDAEDAAAHKKSKKQKRKSEGDVADLTKNSAVDTSQEILKKRKKKSKHADD